jgi:hypothetical protein
MKCTNAIKLCAVFMFALNMFAQATSVAVSEDKIPVYDRYGSPEGVLFLKNDKFMPIDLEKVKLQFASDDKTDKYFLKYVYEGRDYRKLSESEMKQFDAMPKIEIRRGNLYYGDKKIKTNVPRIKEVLAAYYWHGGIIVALHSTKKRFFTNWPYMPNNEIGFINLQTNKCKISANYFSVYKDAIPSFIVPATININNKDLVFDVKVPEKLSINKKNISVRENKFTVEATGKIITHREITANEKLDCVVTLTNKSNKPLLIPDSLFDDLGIFRNKISYPAWPSTFFIKYPEYVKSKSTLLMPSETRSTVASFDVALTSTGDTAHFNKPIRFVFYWDGFLNGEDRGEITRFACEKWVEVHEQ